MSRYDGLIIPRSYNEYINKTDPVAMSQALQLSGVLSAIVAAGDNKAVKSSAVYEALTNYINKTDAATLQQALQLPGVLSGAVAAGDNKAVTSDAVNAALTDAATILNALQLSGVMDNAPTAQSTKPAKSGGIFAANAVIMASSTTLSGVAISAGSVVRVLFTADIAGSDATTGLTFTYNGDAYAVKVGKNGALANFNAYEVESGVFKYLQAHTTLELMFDGSQFVIMGNPVVISNADFSVMADGSLTYHDHISAGQTGFIIIGDILINYGVDTSDDTSYVALPHSYSNANYTLIGYNANDNSPIRGNKFPAGFGTSAPNSICNYIAIGKI